MKKNYDILIDGPAGGGNALFTIFPYKKNGQWMFDDERKSIIMEPFVAGADELLERVSEGKLELTAIFSPQDFRGSQFVLNKIKGDEYGTDYYCEEHKQSVWLCPALFAYLSPAPAKIYVQIK